MSLIALNTEINEELIQEGVYREILRNCQLIRKEAGFEISDRVHLELNSDSELVKNILDKYKKEMEKETLSEIIVIKEPIKTKEISVNNESVVIKISR